MFNLKKFLFLIFIFMITGCVLTKQNSKNVNINTVIVKKTKFPKDGLIITKKNESVFDIANRYGLLPQDIIEANNIKNPLNVPQGKKLFLPYPLIHIVQKGDNIFDLSVRYAVNQSDIVELNDLKKPYILSKNTKIKIPLFKDYSSIGLNNKSKILDKKNYNSKVINAPKFIYPIKGDLIKKFGPYKNGSQHHDGIDIKSFDNQFVKASSDGKVAFVGANIKSFGNMILIKHDKDWISAYSKIGKTIVSEGDFVKRGDHIGSLNASKILHFQIRKSRNPVDPTKIIKD